jgi:hypothetical protein
MNCVNAELDSVETYAKVDHFIKIFNHFYLTNIFTDTFICSSFENQINNAFDLSTYALYETSTTLTAKKK